MLPKPMLPKLLTTQRLVQLLRMLLMLLKLPHSISHPVDWLMTHMKKNLKLKLSTADTFENEPFKKPLPPGRLIGKNGGSRKSSVCDFSNPN